MNNIQVVIEKIRDNAVIPAYAHSALEDAGADLYAVEDVILRKGVPTLVGTGIKIVMFSGVQAEIRSRSGLAAKHGIHVVNSPGTIDPGYRGEIKVILQWDGHAPNVCAPVEDTCIDDPTQYMQYPVYKVKAGDRVAQIVFMPYLAATFVPGDVTSMVSERGEGGGGSTGV